MSSGQTQTSHHHTLKLRILFLTLLLSIGVTAHAEQGPFDEFPAAEPPYYRVRYEASTEPGQLIFPVNYTIWIPPDVKTLSGVIVHQHGCGVGSCKSGLTGAYDLHWQALAKRHNCALLSPSYGQPEGADCQMWCDPRNGSAAAFQRGLSDLGAQSGHPELSQVPWALWGHSGGGHWAGGMVLLFPERVAAAWLRSGVPLLEPSPSRPGINAHALNAGALQVPVMCNLGTKEGVTVKEGRFASVWPANEAFFKSLRSQGGLVGVAVDPLTLHECGNQRYLAIPWFDACLKLRLPEKTGSPLKAIHPDDSWLGDLEGTKTLSFKEAASTQLNPLERCWLPDELTARKWLQYVKDTLVEDTSPPPAPTNCTLTAGRLKWEANADLESGLAGFIIERDGEVIATLPEKAANPFGRPLFQNLQYSDTPTFPLVKMEYELKNATGSQNPIYRITSVNTTGLKSEAIVVSEN